MLQRGRTRAVLAATVLTVLASGPVRAEVLACPAVVVPCCARLLAAPGAADVVAERPLSLGVHVWPSRLVQSPASVAQLLALKPAHLRFSLGPNWRRQPALSIAMSDAALDAAVAAGFASVTGMAEHARSAIALRQATGGQNHLVVWEPPPLPGEPDFAQAGARRWRLLRSEHVALAARFHVANLRYLAQLGVPIDAIEVSNEPDGSWNIKIAPADYLALIQGIRAEAQRRGVALPKIHGPGASRVATTRAFLADRAIGRGILDVVDVLSMHTWDDNADEDRFAQIDRLFQDLEEIGRTPDMSVTEFGLAKPVLGTRGDPMNASKRVPGSVTETPAYPVASLKDLIRLYRGRIGTVIYWEFEDQSWGGGLFGLLDTQGRPKRIYSLYQQFSNALRDTAATRIDVAEDAQLALLRAPGASLLAALNAGPDPLTIVVNQGKAEIPAELAACRSVGGTAGFQVPAGAVVNMRYAAPPK